MKLKLAALLSFIVLGLAGCGSADNKPAANTNAAATPAAATSTPATTAQNTIEASANPTTTTGGTKEGCKCSAVGMACNTKAGEKGCCGGKDGSCSSMRDGNAKCCTPDKAGGTCCSTAKSTAMADQKDMKDMKMSGDEATPAKKGAHAADKTAK